jgi:Holliday junction resolvase RusA-like endonuclease
MITPAQFNEMQSRVAPKSKTSDDPCLVPPTLLYLFGQVRGGKNNMIVTRTGLHFPKPEWAKWRDAKVDEIKHQLPAGFKPYTVPVNMKFHYVAGDKRRRDMPAILDSIFHVLERAGVVKDDSLIWVTESERGYDPKKPFCSMQLTIK